MNNKFSKLKNKEFKPWKKPFRKQNFTYFGTKNKQTVNFSDIMLILVKNSWKANC